MWKTNKSAKVNKEINGVESDRSLSIFPLSLENTHFIWKYFKGKVITVGKLQDGTRLKEMVYKIAKNNMLVDWEL